MLARCDDMSMAPYNKGGDCQIQTNSSAQASIHNAVQCPECSSARIPSGDQTSASPLHSSALKTAHADNDLGR